MSDWWGDTSGFSFGGGDTPDFGTSFDFGGTQYGAGDFGGGFGGGFDTSWLNSYLSPTTQTPAFTSDVLGSRGMYTGGADAGGYTANPQAPYDPSQTAGNPFTQDYGNAGGGIPQPTSAMNIQAGGGQQNPWLSALLGAAGPTAGLLGALIGGGAGQRTTPVLPTAARAQIGQANQALQPFAQGQTPLQMQQASLLNAIASGQGLAQPYAQAIEQAFQPQLGDLYTQAANMGRSRGFYDSPATSPPGGAILGPGLSNLQGQIAAAKIAQMNALPGLFQQPINTQAMAGGQQANTLLQSAGLQQGSQQSMPMGAQVGQGLAGMLGGAAAGYNAASQANQQQQYQNSLLSALKYPGYGA